MDFPGLRSFLAALLNHRSPCVSPGTWESRGMSPTGYPGYPTPLPQHIESRRAGGRPSALERVGGDFRVEFANQFLEHLPHHDRPPNSSSLRIRDSASNRRAVSQEVRVCGGRVPFFLIHFSRNAIVSGSDE